MRGKEEELKITENSVILYEALKAKHKAHPIVQLLIFVAVYLVASMALGIVIGLPAGIYIAAQMLEGMDMEALQSGEVTFDFQQLQGMTKNMPEWFILLSLFGTAFIIGAVIIYCRYIEGRSFASMGLRRQGFLKNYGRGLLIGAVMFFAAAGLSVLLGSARFTGFNYSVSWGYIALFFLGYLVQGASEEFLCRGYLAVSLANRCKVAVAVGISSVVFALMHFGNNGVSPLAIINIALFGAFEAVYMFRSDDLWGACAIHSAWNFVQGNVLGISVSGGAVGNTIFTTSFVEGRELINGGTFGTEGGICATIVLALAIALACHLPMKQRPELPKDEEDIPIEKEALPLYIKK